MQNAYTKSIFEESHIGSIGLKNRIFRTACGDSHGLNGHISDEDISLYTELAEGGIGALITGYTYVSDYGMSENIGMFGIYDDSFISEYHRLTDEVHKRGSKIFMQLVHLGSACLMKNTKIFAPSVVENPMTKTIPEEMTTDDILHVQNAFAEGAYRAMQAGFDGIELHSAHGFLLNQFLSPHFNHRTDEYGGNDENRARFAVQTVCAIRSKVGEDYPIIVKVQSEEDHEDGITKDQFLDYCIRLEKAGVNAIEVSGTWMKYRQNEPYFENRAAELAEKIEIPVILTGGIRDIKTTDRLLNETPIEFIGMCRPFIHTPDILMKWKSGETDRSMCVSCGACSRTHRCVFRK